jgi:hypothetical protein
VPARDLFCPATIVEYDNNPEVARDFMKLFGALCRSTIVRNMLDGLQSGTVEYDNTLSAISVWSDPCGLGKKW